MFNIIQTFYKEKFNSISFDEWQNKWYLTSYSVCNEFNYIQEHTIIRFIFLYLKIPVICLVKSVGTMVFYVLMIDLV